MLTKVILEGPMGKACGRTWAFDISSPSEALRMVDANRPGVFNWIRNNLKKYEAYRVVCRYEDGKTEELDQGSYTLMNKPVEIRFVPIVQGSGNAGRIILGAVLVIAGVWFQQPWLIQMGAGLIVGGVIGLLTPQPKLNSSDEKESKNKTSHFFDGPVNTTEQGVPVQLIYGETVLVGSHAISAEVSIDQLM